MREIKFRAWDRLNKPHSMIAWETLKFRHDIGLDLSDQSEGDETPFLYLQFTGLYDKNGKEIYEGDIVVIPDEYKDRILDDGSSPIKPFNHLAPVIYDKDSFGVIIKENGEGFHIGYWPFCKIESDFGITKYEIIGSIYENPDEVLLKLANK